MANSRSAMLAVALAAVALQPVAAVAAGSKGARQQVTKVCQKAITDKGFGGYRYRYLQFMVPATGGYSLTGQLNKGRKRQEFNCVLDANMRIQDLVLNPLSDSQ